MFESEQETLIFRTETIGDSLSRCSDAKKVRNLHMSESACQANGWRAKAKSRVLHLARFTKEAA